ncbi:class I SAM-dependent methyltransferase [Candidatus Bathyarchaeota archaeon]|nr:class I SAM-dependent methyltransferase [Candidatus Bathyarchaeota archaeon]MBS7613223.1 class I SAM-dependent methyltransferase [Candidatus Bathyarchaeota archaeon]MBS7617255.1 class I SAM-dependent methyltransferase [Candidatus Bathyarchaeota archaeon]
MSFSNASEEESIPQPPIHPSTIYKALAKHIVENYGVEEGLCLDIGSGVGLLGIELARLTQLKVLLLDVDRKALVGGLTNAKHFKVEGRVSAVLADAHNLPFKPNSVNLVVSRGVIPFSKDRVKMFKEVYRVLVEHGFALIGGGIHSGSLKYLPEHSRERLREEVRMRMTRFFSSPQGRGYDHPDKWRLEEWLREAGIRQFRIISDDPGKWIEILKP